MSNIDLKKERDVKNQESKCESDLDFHPICDISDENFEFNQEHTLLDGWSAAYPITIARSITTVSPTPRFLYTPDFDSAIPNATLITSVTIEMTGSRYHDFIAANKEAGLPGTPRGYTWHHVYRPGGLLQSPRNLTALCCQMQLVDTNMHRKTCSHLGAVSQWVLQKGGGKYKLQLPEDFFLNRNKEINSPIDVETINSLDAPEEIKQYFRTGEFREGAPLILKAGENLICINLYPLLDDKGRQIYFQMIAENDLRNELKRLDVWPIGEDEGGIMAFYQGASQTFWIYDHDYSLGKPDGSIFYQVEKVDY